MSVPKLHHYLPQFLMRPWVGDDGCVTSYFRPHDKVVAKRKSPKAIGGKTDLYTLRWRAFASNETFVETQFFGRLVDDPAAKVRDRLLAGGVDALSPKERECFAAFLLYQHVRGPDVLTASQDRYETALEEKVIEVRAEGQSTEDARNDYRTHLEGVGEAKAMLAMMQAVINTPVRQQILDLTWRVFDSGGIDLVLADEPVIFAPGPGNGLRVVALPLSPDKMFVASTPKFLSDHIFEERFSKVLGIAMCVEQERKAKKFIIAKDGRHSTSIERHLGKNEQRPSPLYVLGANICTSEELKTIFNDVRRRPN